MVPSFTSNTAQPRDIMSVFARAAAGDASQKPSALENSMAGQKQSLMTKVTGINFAANLPKIDMAAMKPETVNHIPNLKDIQAGANTAREQVASVAADFKSEVSKVQNGMDAAMTEAAKNLNIDLKQAQVSIKPDPVATGTDALAAMAGNAALPGPTASGAQVAIEYSQERGKLKPEQEARLLDEMRALLSPKRDVNGNIVAPAKIPTEYNFEEITNEEMKALYKPAEQHPEGEEIFDMLHKLDEEVLPHLEYAEAHQDDNTGNKLQAATAKGDEVAVATLSGSDLAEAVEKITGEVETPILAAAVEESAPDLTLADIEVWSGSLEDTALSTPEVPVIDPEVTQALVRLQEEALRRELERNAAVSFKMV